MAESIDKQALSRKVAGTIFSDKPYDITPAEEKGFRKSLSYDVHKHAAAGMKVGGTMGAVTGSALAVVATIATQGMAAPLLGMAGLGAATGGIVGAIGGWTVTVTTLGGQKIGYQLGLKDGTSKVAGKQDATKQHADRIKDGRDPSGVQYANEVFASKEFANSIGIFSESAQALVPEITGAITKYIKAESLRFRQSQQKYKNVAQRDLEGLKLDGVYKEAQEQYNKALENFTERLCELPDISEDDMLNAVGLYEKFELTYAKAVEMNHSEITSSPSVR